jgi:hypothetical protein
MLQIDTIMGSLGIPPSQFMQPSTFLLAWFAFHSVCTNGGLT